MKASGRIYTSYFPISSHGSASIVPSPVRQYERIAVLSCQGEVNKVCVPVKSLLCFEMASDGKVINNTKSLSCTANFIAGSSTQRQSTALSSTMDLFSTGIAQPTLDDTTRAGSPAQLPPPKHSPSSTVQNKCSIVNTNNTNNKNNGPSPHPSSRTNTTNTLTGNGRPVPNTTPTT